MKQTIYMETTKKEPEQTSAEIEMLLQKYGMVRYMKEYQDGAVSGCVFFLETEGHEVPIRLPVRWEPLYAMAQRGETRYIRDQGQARRVAWRQILRWIEAQLALIDLGMVELPEVFLPYMMADKNRTFYQMMVANGMTLKLENRRVDTGGEA